MNTQQKKYLGSKNKALKISSKKLAEMIQATIGQIVMQEGTHFTAMRNIEHIAAATSMDFEKTITDALGLMHPDKMPPELQAKYYEIATEMKDRMRKACLDAAKALLSFPRQDDGKNGK